MSRLLWLPRTRGCVAEWVAGPVLKLTSEGERRAARVAEHLAKMGASWK